MIFGPERGGGRGGGASTVSHHCSGRGVNAGSLSTTCAAITLAGHGFGPGRGYLERGFLGALSFFPSAVALAPPSAAAPPGAASAHVGRDAAIPREVDAPIETEAGLIQLLAAPGAATIPTPRKSLLASILTARSLGARFW
jgi:hypothetical protein